MASLKDLRNRISSVRNTRKITSAMKMVAGAKLRRAQEAAEAARPYAERMSRMLGSLATSMKGQAGASPLMVGTGKDQVNLIVVVTSDRGLCGGFNTAIVRRARQLARRLQGEGKTVKFLCVGRKGRDQLRRDFGPHIIDTITDVGRKQVRFGEADQVAERITGLYREGAFDVCVLLYNRFKSAISQIPTEQQLIPFASGPITGGEAAAEGAPEAGTAPRASYEYEPDEKEILAALLPRNLSIQIFRALLESNASEHGARMTAMDNATRNASDMIGRLTLVYNRTRQAQITKELIEIISGAEAI
ncbi:MAG: F0F1 ATP synthase subunit gamma [Rhodospirillaceae bacterium]|nr:F0F1 ATP synthase subunit gamma [Rhodospirillaceae bacterium]